MTGVQTCALPIFCFNIAWPVVPEPAKKSNIIAFGLRHCAIRNCINDTGFGKSNARLPRIWIISRLPFRVYPTVSGKTVDNPVYLLDISLKNFFSLGRPFFLLGNKILPSAIFWAIVSLEKRHPVLGLHGYTIPVAGSTKS